MSRLEKFFTKNDAADMLQIRYHKNLFFVNKEPSCFVGFGFYITI